MDLARRQAREVLPVSRHRQLVELSFQGKLPLCRPCQAFAHESFVPPGKGMSTIGIVGRVADDRFAGSRRSTVPIDQAHCEWTFIDLNPSPTAFESRNPTLESGLPQFLTFSVKA